MESDEVLYARVRHGDMGAFDLLYERYESRLFGFLLSQLKNRTDAEDAFHEAFLNAFKSRQVSFDVSRGGGFRAWLYRIARNIALNRLRSDRRSDRAVAGYPAAEPTQSAEEHLAQSELLSELDRAVARLPPTLSELFHLRCSGLSYEEMSNVLEIPLGTLKSRMHQMVAHLREELKPWTAT